MAVKRDGGKKSLGKIEKLVEVLSLKVSPWSGVSYAI